MTETFDLHDPLNRRRILTAALRGVAMLTLGSARRSSAAAFGPRAPQRRIGTQMKLSRSNPLVFLGVAALLGVTALSFAPLAGTGARDIWFNMTSYVSPNGVDGPQGWNRLFVDPGAPWPDFMNHVQVVAAVGRFFIPGANFLFIRFRMPPAPARTTSSSSI